MLTKYSDTVSLGRNHYQTTIGIKPINYQDGSTWKRISNDWADSGIGDRPHIVTSAPFITSVSPDGLRRIHPTREDDVWFEMSGAKINNAGTWNVVPLGTPTSRKDNRITWNRTNFNAYMDMAGHYVKLGYLLKNGYLPPNNQFAYEVSTQGLTRQGGTLLKDGVPVMRMRAPVAYDYDNPEDVRQIAHEIVRIDGKWHVVFTLPSLAGMSKPLIDPTLTLQPDAAAGKDTFIYSSVADTNFDADANGLRIGDLTSSGTEASRGLIKYDLSSLSATATVTDVTLSLYEHGASGGGNEPVNFHRVLENWVEGEATWNIYSTGNNWNTAGCSGANTDKDSDVSATVSLDAIAASDFVDWTGSTLIDDVQKIVDGTYANNYGWELECPNKEDTAGGAQYNQFWDSDHATAAYRPKLVVNWTAAKKHASEFFSSLILFDNNVH